MNHHTKKIFIVSLILLIASLGLCALLMSHIHTKGTRLEEYTVALARKNAEEAAFIKVTRLVQETATERDSIDQAFFTDESESVSFLGNIEGFADSIGLTLSTDNLDKVTGNDNTSEYITMTFIYSGERQQVLNFTKYLEDIPYYSKIDHLTYNKTQNGLWEGTLTLLIGMKKSP